MSDAEFWSRQAPSYAKSAIADPAAYEETLARIAARLSPSDSVLEVGCGTGSTALRLAPGVGRLTATDLAPGMIEIARAKAAEDGRTNVAFEVAAADAAGGDGPYDAVLALNLLHLTADPAGTMAALADKLRPGGVLISKTPCLGGGRAALFGPLIGAMRLAGKAPQVRLLTPARLEAMAASAGLVVEERLLQGGAVRRLFLVARKPTGRAAG